MKRATEQRTWDCQPCFFHSKAMCFYFIRNLICVMQADLFPYDFQCYDLGHKFCGRLIFLHLALIVLLCGVYLGSKIKKIALFSQ